MVGAVQNKRENAVVAPSGVSICGDWGWNKQPLGGWGRMVLFLNTVTTHNGVNKWGECH